MKVQRRFKRIFADLDTFMVACPWKVYSTCASQLISVVCGRRAGQQTTQDEHCSFNRIQILSMWFLTVVDWEMSTPLPSGYSYWHPWPPYPWSSPGSQIKSTSRWWNCWSKVDWQWSSRNRANEANKLFRFQIKSIRKFSKGRSSALSIFSATDKACSSSYGHENDPQLIIQSCWGGYWNYWVIQFDILQTDIAQWDKTNFAAWVIPVNMPVGRQVAVLQCCI